MPIFAKRPSAHSLSKLITNRLCAWQLIFSCCFRQNLIRHLSCSFILLHLFGSAMNKPDTEKKSNYPHKNCKINKLTCNSVVDKCYFENHDRNSRDAPRSRAYIYKTFCRIYRERSPCKRCPARCRLAVHFLRHLRCPTYLNEQKKENQWDIKRKKLSHCRWLDYVGFDNNCSVIFDWFC